MSAAPRMSKWMPDESRHQSRRIGKTLEELGELSGVLARISIQGMDAIDPASGKTNRQRLHEETADVVAQINCNIAAFSMDTDGLKQRTEKKVLQMADWESHFTDSASDAAPQAAPELSTASRHEAVTAGDMPTLPTLPTLPKSLLNLIGEYGMARTDRVSELEIQHRWLLLIAGIKDYAFDALAARAAPGLALTDGEAQ